MRFLLKDKYLINKFLKILKTVCSFFIVLLSCAATPFVKLIPLMKVQVNDF